MDTELFSDFSNYNFMKNIIEVVGQKVLIEKDAINPEVLPLLLHEYIHYYIQFNSLYHYEGYLYYILIIIELAQTDKSKVPFFENFDKLEKINLKKFIDCFKNWNNRQGKNFKNKFKYSDSYINENFKIGSINCNKVSDELP